MYSDYCGCYCNSRNEGSKMALGQWEAGRSRRGPSKLAWKIPEISGRVEELLLLWTGTVFSRY